MAENPDWTNRELQDSAAAYAIRHLRGVAKEDRIGVLTMLIVNSKLGVTAEMLDKWCHRYEHPDIASGLVTKDVEGQAAVIEHRAVTHSGEAPDETEDMSEDQASRYRAEGFRAYADLIAPATEAVRWHYAKAVRRGTSYAKGPDGRALSRLRTKALAAGDTWRCVEGGGSVLLATGETVAYVTSATIGIRGGAVVWALPEVGPGRIWERAHTRRLKSGGTVTERALNYQPRVLTYGVAPAVIGVRAVALACHHAPGAVDHAGGAELSRQIGLASRQLMHHHQTRVEQEIQRRVRGATKL